jgi:3-dehydroquinate synthase
MRDLVLTGFMGTGKTTIGKLLAARYGLRFVDTDEEIARRTGRSVADIISRDGEAAFRRIERDMLRRLAPGSGRVIATGGGALLTAENRALFAEDQPVLCLTCEPAQLLWRLTGNGDRPLLDPPSLQRIADLLEARSEAYASFPQLDTTGKDPETVAAEIAARHPLERATEIEFTRISASSILIGEGVLDRIGGAMATVCDAGPVLFLTDETVAALGHANRVEASLRRAGYDPRRVALPAGEQVKSMPTLERLYGEGLDAGLSRSGAVVGVGGGVICDLAGMLAATYMRGVHLVLAPTTLLAQVDAAIGGKVAVDATGVKNLAGAFYPADVVAIDPLVLQTLNDGLLSEGMAEVIKIAFVQSAELLTDLERLAGARDVLGRTDIARLAALLKADLVARDPYERGDRALLNFGHTVGHGLEAASGYRLSHGEAIAIGMIAELRIAVELGHSQPGLLPRLTDRLASVGLPTSGFSANVDPSDVLRAMGGDKKRASGVTRFAVPVAAGEGAVIAVSKEDEERAIDLAFSLDPLRRGLVSPWGHRSP